MSHHVIIDGNNLLYAMHAHAPLPNVGRETLVRIIERWSALSNVSVTLVFDGGAGPSGLAKQMTSSRIDVQFSGAKTADDLIVSMIHDTKNAGETRIITTDTAIKKEASHRRCRQTDSAIFVAELFPPNPPTDRTPTHESPEKPENLSSQETEDWLKLFGPDPTDGLDLSEFDLPCDP